MTKLEGEAWLNSSQKRAVDIGIATTLIPLSAPLLGVAAASIRIADGVNPLFLQERTGQYPDSILIPKLRTLRGPVENGMSPNGHLHERATKIGSIVRRLHADELPQLSLVLRGDMSIVGLRPIVLDEFEKTMDVLNAHEQKEWQRARKVAKPGLMSLFGLRHHTTGLRKTFIDRVQDDIEYAHTASFRVDSDILAAEINQAIISVSKRS